ncbi:TMEM165/GDT1 family protein [Thermostichus vulcanus]|uniref:GDT1 family protein n=1 Tax=Thermostichus vulcanus str. 'Rupite' TaxID=2813851 RepID=A0ABT0CAZ3_THEVL|nr:TMEM165/GDT1 family protein [Thermostichus vulcanus]MCJ2542963.1 TMEM165/GDT1 family protein [Thermostichus vulcanus str. 'Rupite']
MTSPRSWEGQLVLGLGLTLVSLVICLGFLAFGQQYLEWDWHPGSASALAAVGLGTVPSPEIAFESASIPTEVAAADSSVEGARPQLWFMTFLTVFVAEMGDKTQLATLLMSAQSRSPWAIFFGSASALVTASLLSVLLGGGLGQVIPSDWLQWLAGAGFLVIGSYVLWQEWQGDTLPES